MTAWSVHDSYLLAKKARTVHKELSGMTLSWIQNTSYQELRAGVLVEPEQDQQSPTDTVSQPQELGQASRGYVSVRHVIDCTGILDRFFLLPFCLWPAGLVTELLAHCFHLLLCWQQSLVAIDSNSCQRSFPRFCVPPRQWLEVYDLCHIVLHVARVKKHTARIACDSRMAVCFSTRNVQKPAKKSDTSGHHPVPPFEVAVLFNWNLSRCSVLGHQSRSMILSRMRIGRWHNCNFVLVLFCSDSETISLRSTNDLRIQPSIKRNWVQASSLICSCEIHWIFIFIWKKKIVLTVRNLQTSPQKTFFSVFSKIHGKTRNSKENVFFFCILDKSGENNGQGFWGDIAPRLYSRYNNCPCARPTHVASGPRPNSKCSKTVELGCFC